MVLICSDRNEVFFLYLEAKLTCCCHPQHVTGMIPAFLARAAADEYCTGWKINQEPGFLETLEEFCIMFRVR